MEFMGIKGDRPEGAADGQFCIRRKCRRLRCGVLAAVLVKVLVEVNDEKELREYKVEQLKFRRRQHGRGRKNGEGDEKEMKELEKLERQEKKEGKSKLDD